jgi:4-hydroxy-tetrahydrodipicolinate reductase
MSTERKPIIALIGYGRMGRAIHEHLKERGYPQPLIVDPARADATATLAHAAEADVCIEFTHPSAVVENLILLSDLHVPVVCGTTGWSSDASGISELYRSKGGALVTATNYSVGVHMLKRLTQLASEMAGKFAEYDVSIHEMHHRGKADAPSGTALSLAEIVMEYCARKSTLLQSLPSRKVEDHELCISSSRTGHIVGMHEVLMDSEIDTLRISHEAKNRDGFVEGAMMAAHWIIGKQGVFSVEEMFDDIIAK